MDSCSGPEIPLVVSEDLVPTPAPHIDICTEVLSPVLEPCEPSSLSSTRSLKSGKGVDEDKINAMHPITSLVHSVLANFVIAMSLISSIIFAVFFAVTWFTVLRDVRLMKDQVLSNATGVSLSPCFNGCALLMVVVAVGINTWPRPSTGP